MDDLAHEIAVEHVLWAAAHDQQPADVLRSIGLTWRSDSASTETVVLALRCKWLQIRPAAKAVLGRTKGDR